MRQRSILHRSPWGQRPEGESRTSEHVYKALSNAVPAVIRFGKKIIHNQIIEYPTIDFEKTMNHEP